MEKGIVLARFAGYIDVRRVVIWNVPDKFYTWWSSGWGLTWTLINTVGRTQVCISFAGFEDRVAWIGVYCTVIEDNWDTLDALVVFRLRYELNVSMWYRLWYVVWWLDYCGTAEIYSNFCSLQVRGSLEVEAKIGLWQVQESAMQLWITFETIEHTALVLLRRSVRTSGEYYEILPAYETHRCWCK
jgi:hypothetical protein